jgi:hypothetical protein
MTFTLFDLTYELAVELGIVVEGIATAGNTTTLTDTDERLEDVHYWVGGTLWIIESTDGVAPQGEYGIVSAFASNVVTIRDAITAMEAGDKYAIGKKRFPLNLLIQGVNRAIRDLGTIPIDDITTITTAANQTEYDLPIAANFDLRQVHIQTHSGDSDQNLWRETHNWMLQRTGTGVADKLVFRQQPPHPYAIKLTYMAQHDKLHDSSDRLSENVPLDRIVFRSAQHTLMYYRMRTRLSEDWLTDNIEYYRTIADAMDARLPIEVPPRPGKLMIVKKSYRSYPGDRTPR